MGGPLAVRIGTDKDCAELATKVLYVGKHNLYVSNLLYDIYDNFREFRLQS